MYSIPEILDDLKGLELYVVTCDQFHTAYGPFQKVAAHKFCSQMNHEASEAMRLDDEAWPCIYRVTNFALILDVKGGEAMFDDDAGSAY